MPALTNPLVRSIEEGLGPLFGNAFTVKDYQPVGGGCINQGGYLSTSYGAFFLKFNHSRYQGMFEVEARGLQLLAETGALHIPLVYCTGETDDQQHFIVMEWIGTSVPRSDFWERLGQGLSELHSRQSATYGLHFDNYIGSLPQYNTPYQDWSTFFQQQRLEPQLQLGLQSGRITRALAQEIRDLYPVLSEYFPSAPPSLLHGDLWGGNLIVDEAGAPALIDPAVYYGHPEMELAFTSLFGGFNDQFYGAYQAHSSMPNDFEQRKDLYNLYPLLVHVNLFGGSYLQQVKQVLRKIK